jgi:hypothetical protein
MPLFIFFPVLGLEPKALYMLGKDSTTELHPKSLLLEVLGLMGSPEEARSG